MNIYALTAKELAAFVKKAQDASSTDTISEGISRVGTLSEVPSNATGFYSAPDGRIRSFVNGLEVNSTNQTFDPLSMQNRPLVWLDATKGMMKDTVSAAVVGNVVASIPDRSGNDHPITITGSPVVGQTNGLLGIAFNGTTQNLVTDAFLNAALLANGFTVLTVAFRGNKTSSALQVNTSIGVNPGGMFMASQPSANQTSTALGTVANLGGVTRGFEGLFMMAYSGDTTQKMANGLNTLISCDPSGVGFAQLHNAKDTAYIHKMLNTYGLATTEGLRIGSYGASGYGWEGIWHETIFWAGMLSTSDLSKAMGYLRAKYSILDLPLHIPMGDSIVSGSLSSGTDGQSQFTGTSNWPNQLKSLLGGESAVAVRTLANPGMTTGRMLSLIKENRTYAALYNPYSTKTQVVELAIGINDLALGGTADDCIYGINKLVDEIKSVGLDVIVQTITNQNYSGYTANKASFDINRPIVNNYIKNNFKFTDLSIDPGFENPNNATNPYYGADNIHFTDVGYAKYAAAVRDRLAFYRMI